MNKHNNFLRAILFFVFCFSYSISLAQKQGQARIDSLLTTLWSYKSPCKQPCLKDSSRVIILNDLVYDLSSKNPDTALILGNEALDLSKKINWEIGIGRSYHNIGWTNYRKSEYSNAMLFYDSALFIWQKLEKKINEKIISGNLISIILNRKASTLSNIGIAYANKGDFNQANIYFEQALKIGEEYGNTQLQASVLGNLGISFRNKGEYTKALEYYFKALKLAKEKGNKNEISRHLCNIGIVYDEQGNYAKAIEKYFEALKLSEEIENKFTIASCLLNIGLAFHEQKDYTKAIEYYLRALKIDEEIGDKKGLSIINGNIGNIYAELKEFDKALEYMLRGLKIDEENNYKKGITSKYGNIGNVYKNKKDFATAMNYYLKSLKLSEELENKSGMAIQLGSIGNLYVLTKEFKFAEKYLLQSLNLSDSIGDLFGIMNTNQSLSDLYSQLGDDKTAFMHYQLAMVAKDSLFNEEKTKEITQNEMNYEFEKKEELAKFEYDKQIAIAKSEKMSGIAIADRKRTLAEVDKKLALAEADKKFTKAESEKRIAVAESDKRRMVAEADKKGIKVEAEKQMADVKAENEKQKFLRNSIAGGAGVIVISSLFSFYFYKRKRDVEQNQKETSLNLQVSETEMKALRSQMNPHFIFNALQSIQTFLLSHKPDDANTYLLKFSKLMRAVLENSQHREVSLQKDMQALELYMQLESIRLPHPFTYRFHIDENVDVEETTIPPLILQPFVENAIWHGLQYKPGPGHINIYISKKENALYATVEDNGVGRDVSKKAEQPMLLKKESLGMKLTEERLKILNELKKIKAQFKITDLFTKDNQPAGTKIELSLPN